MHRDLRADNPSAMTLDGTHTFVVGTQRPVVIDPGPEDAEHLRAVERALGGRVPVAILLTHAHADHAAAAPALARLTGAPIRMGAGSLSLPFAHRLLGPPVEDGEVVDTDAGPVRAVATPGHAPEHLCFHWSGHDAPAAGALFVGDLFMGVGDTTLVAPPEGSLADYLRSLDRVEALGAGVLIPAHGPAIADPVEAVERYRRHRLQRVAQVERALSRQPGAGLDRLVDEVYGPALDPRLRVAAEASLSAVLQYLRTTH